MIGGLVTHDGAPALAIHLGRCDQNDEIVVRTHGLSATGLADGLAELRLMALGCRARQSLIHAWASPSVAYSDEDWDRQRQAFEEEFDLVGAPNLEVYHRKAGAGGRTAIHVHRVYLRIRPDGRATSVSHSAARIEKLSRMAEFAAGERFTSGRFNRSVIARLREDGRADVADAMLRAGLGEIAAPRAVSAAERAMTERHADLAADEVWRRAADAWRRADSGPAFASALAEMGLRIAMGDTVPVVVSPGGAVHPLLRAINKGGQRLRAAAIRKRDLELRLRGLTLPRVTDLPAIPGHDAGPFAITNLDRLPSASPADNAAAPEHAPVAPRLMPEALAHPVASAPLPAPEEAAPVFPPAQMLRPAAEAQPPVPAEQKRELTREQRAALAALDLDLLGAAGDRARATRARIEQEIAEARAKRARAHDLARRIAAERSTWELPGIGVVGWREAWRAELAGLPRAYGPRLRWVEQHEGDHRTVQLKSGTIVHTSPGRTWTESPGTPDAMAAMIVYARHTGWRHVTITGRPEWREEMARAATRAGLVVADADLAGIVLATRETQREHADLLAQWQRLRALALAAAGDERKAARKLLLTALAEIVTRPDIAVDIPDPELQERLRSDLTDYAAWQASRAAALAGTRDPPEPAAQPDSLDPPGPRETPDSPDPPVAPRPRR